MKRALILTMLAAVTAGVGLWATTLVPRPPSGATPLSGSEGDADRLPPPFDPDRAGQRGGGGRQPSAIGEARSPVLITELEGGQRVEVRGREIRPMGSEEYRLGRPQALVFLDRESALVVEAAEGRIVAPDGRPVFGQMYGPEMGITLAYYEAPAGEDVQLGKESPHLALACYLEDAEVDLQLGQIRSRGPVELRSREVTFRGQGLDLTYNSLDQRIERLVVRQGRDLVIRPALAEAGDAGDDVAPGQARDDQGRAADEVPDFWYRARFRDQVNIRTGEYETHDGDELAVYFSSVVGRGRGGFDRPGAARLPRPGDQGGDGRASTLVKRGDAGPGHAAPAGGGGSGFGLGPLTTVAGLTLARATAPVLDELEQGDPPLPMPAPDQELPALDGVGPKPDDIYLTWAGPLVVEPVAQPPVAMQGPEEVFASLERVDLTASPKEGDPRRMLAQRMDYHSLTGRLRAVGSAEQPLHLSSPSLGRLESIRGGRDAQIVFEPEEHRGLWVGPGMLRTVADEAAAEAAPLSLPPGLRMAWRDRIELRFAAEQQAGQAPTGRGVDATMGRTVESVSFIGDVRTRHRDFTIDAGRLALYLAAPVDGRQDVERFHASERAKLMTREVGHRMPMTVEGDTLDIRLSRDDRGVMQPRHFGARGQVQAALPEKQLESGRLDLTLESHEKVTEQAARRAAEEGPRVLPPQPVPDDPFDPFPADPLPDEQIEDDQADPQQAQPMLGGTRLVVRKLDAGEDVRIDLDDAGTRIEGERVVADSVLGRLDLWGTADRPARLSRSDGWIEGIRIILLEDTGTVEVPGPGSLQLTSEGGLDSVAVADEENGQDASAEAGDDAAEAAEPAVNFAAWNGSMVFENKAGKARFRGGVYFRSRELRRQRQFWSEDLDLAFTPLESDDPHPAADEDAGDDVLARAATGKPFAAGEQQRRLLDLRAREPDGQAIYLEEDYQDEVDGRLIRRLRLAGPDIHYDDLDQQLTVRGRGSFFYQDLLGEADERAGRRGPAGMAGISGPGDTLFNWQGVMRLDLRSNDVRLSRGVAMSHRPLGRDDTFHLYAAEVYADFTPRAEIDAIAGGDDEDDQPRLRVVRADGDGLDSRVRVVSPERELICDQMVYHAAGGRIRMHSREDRWVQVITEGDPTMVTARRVIWDIETDRIDIHQPGPTFTIPGQQRDRAGGGDGR